MNYHKKEIIELTGISEKMLRDYVKVKLINPQKADNNYYVYKESDIYTIAAIKLLKDCGYTLKEIKKIFDQNNNLFNRVLVEGKKRLEKEKKELEVRLKIIEMIQQTDFDNPVIHNYIIKLAKPEIIPETILKYDKFKAFVSDKYDKMTQYYVIGTKLVILGLMYNKNVNDNEVCKCVGELIDELFKFYDEETDEDDTLDKEIILKYCADDEDGFSNMLNKTLDDSFQIIGKNECQFIKLAIVTYIKNYKSK